MEEEEVGRRWKRNTGKGGRKYDSEKESTTDEKEDTSENDDHILIRG